MSEITKIGKKEGVCPFCGETEDLHYDSLLVDGNSCYYEVTCNSCNNDYDEFYKLKFDGQWGDKDLIQSKKKGK